MIYENPKPLVSVILPTFNRGTLILGAIESVLGQTYTNWELLVVDDGSTDNTTAIVGQVLDPRIRYIFNRQNRGAAAARNVGINRAKGIYIAFVDSDDRWFPNKLEKQLNMFTQDDSLGAVGCGRVIRLPSGREYVKVPSGTFGNIYERLLRGKSFPGGTPTIIFKRECFSKVGLFDETLPAFEDNDLYFRVSRFYNFGVIREPLVAVYIQTKGLNSNLSAQFAGRRMLLEKYSNDIPLFCKLRGVFNHKIGLILLHQKSWKEAQKYFLMAVVSYPFSIKLWKRFLLSISPFYQAWIRRRDQKQW